FSEHTALLCSSFIACAVRAGSLRRVDALIFPLVGHALAAQRFDVLGIGCADCGELCEYLLRRSTLEKGGMQPGKSERLRGREQAQQSFYLGIGCNLCCWFLRRIRDRTNFIQTGSRMTNPLTSYQSKSRPQTR